MKLITILILFIPTFLISQNLVKNPSFEKTKKCADNASTFKSNLEQWSIPSLGTTDLFNSCSTGETGIPDNFNGNQNSKFGENYAGFFLYAPNNYREYIEGYFKSPLEKDKKYNVSFYISLADKSNYALKKISFILTKNVILTPYWTTITQSQIQNLITSSFSINTIENKRSYNDKNNWILVTKEITAKGGERCITIGNFQNNSSTKLKKVLKGKSNKMSYYYIDMVSVELIDKPLINLTKTIQPNDKKETEITKETKIELNKKYVFQNINFNFNSVELTQAAKTEINVLYEYLNSNQNAKIIILGHTDNLGSTNYNKVLSEKRAKSVAAYLIKSGINKKRIQSIGHGNSQPLSTNKTDEGRKKNRRVEFKITKHNN